MNKWMNDAGLSRLWSKVKTYVADNTYPKEAPPDLYFDAETATLYIGKTPVGYDFAIDGAVLYYKERSA
ncbi:MAG: hypothetical protein Q4C60_07770 [Eubacteriales bacterium]|nr:hypothetical protein [Eubacteriales bacterium]